MDAVTYPHPDVQGELARWSLLEVDVSAFPDVAHAAQVAAIPTALLLAEDGTVLDRLVGFVEPGAFRDRLVAARSR